MKSLFKENTIYAKLICIILLITTFYTIVHTFIYEVGFSGFASRFLVYIEMYLNSDYSLNINYIPLIPLINSTVFIDPNLPQVSRSILLTESVIPFAIIEYLVLLFLTGLSPQVLMKLAVGSIFTSISYLAMTRVHIGSQTSNSHYIYVTLISIYGFLYICGSLYANNLYAASFALTLLFLVFLCFKKILENNQVVFFSFLLYVLIFCLAEYWHTMLFTALFFLATTVFIIYILFILNKLLNNYISLSHINKIPLGLLLVCIIISITFNHLWQIGYIATFFGEFEISDYIFNIISKFKGEHVFIMPYKFSYKSWPLGELHFLSILYIYILALLTLIMPLTQHLLNAIKNRRLIVDVSFIFCISILISQLIYSLAYFGSESVNFFYVPLFFPLFGSMLMIRSKKGRSMEFVFIFLLIILCILSCMSIITQHYTHESGNTPITKFDDTKSSFNWFMEYQSKQLKAIADYNIMHKYLQREAKISNNLTTYTIQNPYIYGAIIGDSASIPAELKDAYIIVDKATMSRGLPVDMRGSRSFLLIPKWYNISSSDNHIKIYDDAYISIFQFKS